MNLVHKEKSYCTWQPEEETGQQPGELTIRLRMELIHLNEKTKNIVFSREIKKYFKGILKVCFWKQEL